MRKPAEERKVLQIEIVSGVDAETKRVRELRSRRVSLEALFTLARLERARKWLRVELDAIAADGRRPSHRLGNRIDEEADPNAQLSSCC